MAATVSVCDKASLPVESKGPLATVDAWAGRWITPGFEALETLVGRNGAGWSFGDTPGLVDCYLIPQIYSARRFNVPLEAFPRLLAIEAAAAQHPAFIAAHPDRQPDAY